MVRCGGRSGAAGAAAGAGRRQQLDAGGGAAATAPGLVQLHAAASGRHAPRCHHRQVHRPRPVHRRPTSYRPQTGHDSAAHRDL